jgi:uncharacterized membrane protein YccC
MTIQQLCRLVVARENPSSMWNAARTAVAALVSFLVARLFQLPEAYWALVSTLIVMQSTLGAALPVSVQRFAGTVLGAAAGAAAATWFPGNIWIFALGLYLLGVLCALLRVERSAYRYAGITLAIVMLVERPTSGWIIAIHRFLEVSLGIAVGLVLSAVWPERSSGGSRPAPGS